MKKTIFFSLLIIGLGIFFIGNESKIGCIFPSVIGYPDEYKILDRRDWTKMKKSIEISLSSSNVRKKSSGILYNEVDYTLLRIKDIKWTKQEKEEVVQFLNTFTQQELYNIGYFKRFFSYKKTL